MLHVRPLLRGPSLFLGDVVCNHGRSGFGPREAAGDFTIILPRAGMFVGLVRGEHVVADPGGAMFLGRDDDYRIRHPVDGGDRSTVLCLGQGLVRDLLTSHGLAGHDAEAIAFPSSHAATSASLDREHRRLIHALAAGHDPTALAEQTLLLAGALVARAAGAACASPSPRARRLAHAAREILAQRFAETVALPDLARELDCSPYHLCRTFRAVVGTGPHGYQTGLRVRAAAESLAAGEADLADLAHRLGFADHAHFSNSFRRVMGASPSTYRSRMRAPRSSPGRCR